MLTYYTWRYLDDHPEVKNRIYEDVILWKCYWYKRDFLTGCIVTPLCKAWWKLVKSYWLYVVLWPVAKALGFGYVDDLHYLRFGRKKNGTI